MNTKFEGELADFALQEYRANPTFIENLIAKGEGALQAFLVAVFKQVRIGGLAGIVLPEIEGGIEAFVAQLIAKYPPATLYTMLGDLLASEAKALGG